MRKSIVVAALGGVALAGIAIAAAGGNAAKDGGGFVTLAASGGSTSPATAVQASPAALADGSQVDANGKIADSWICVFRAGAVGRGSERGEAMRSANAGGGSVKHVYGHALQGFSVRASAQGVARMQANNRRIDYCEQDQVMALVQPIVEDSRTLAKPGGGGVTQPAEITPPGITRVGGGATGGFLGKAWVIDTGIDLDHLDLNVDVASSRNFVSNESSPNDLNGHGSHVAGTIAGIDNTIGTVGVAAGAPVIAIRVLNRRGSGSNSDVIAGVDYVAANGAAGDVANMSLGGGVSPALDTAVFNAAAVVKFALAAGNDSGDADLHSPARVDRPGQTFTVAAYSTFSNAWASFSNFGKPPVDYAEPGVSIFSTWKDGGYNTISGTSMATPHLAGLLLLGGIRDGGTVTRIAGDSYVIGVR